MRASLDIAITPMTTDSRSGAEAFSGSYSCMLTLRCPGAAGSLSIGGSGRSQAVSLAQALRSLADVLGCLSPSEMATLMEASR